MSVYKEILDADAEMLFLFIRISIGTVINRLRNPVPDKGEEPIYGTSYHHTGQV
jgi:hypothetical protein